jgi:hypothetical protein
LYEAAQMASSAPTVNTKTDIVIARADGAITLPCDLPPPPDAPITLDELKRLAKRYGPKSTSAM